MRVLGIWTWLLAPAFALAQNNIRPATAIRPQAIVQVSKTKVGADLVLLTVLDHDYPPQLLQRQANMIGSLTRSGIRGLQVFQTQLDKDDPSSAFWKASFAADGLFDNKNGVLRLEPIVAALAGAPAPHTLEQFYVEFEGAKVESATLGDYSSPAVLVTRTIQGPTTEYAVTLLTQNPSDIHVPDSSAPQSVPGVPAASRRMIDWVVVSSFFVAAIAAGALVYSLLLILLRSGTRRGLRR